jgi:hypothetical protein
MDHALAWASRARADMQEHRHTRVHGRVRAVERLAQALAVEVLHHHVRHAVRHAEVDDIDDVRWCSRRPRASCTKRWTTTSTRLVEVLRAAPSPRTACARSPARRGTRATGRLRRGSATAVSTELAPDERIVGTRGSSRRSLIVRSAERRGSSSSTEACRDPMTPRTRPARAHTCLARAHGPCEAYPSPPDGDRIRRRPGSLPSLASVSARIHARRRVERADRRRRSDPSTVPRPSTSRTPSLQPCAGLPLSASGVLAAAHA